MQSQDITSLHANTCQHGVTGFCPDCAIMEEIYRVYRENRRQEQIKRNRPIVSMSGRD
jgi:ribosomal protein S26